MDNLKKEASAATDAASSMIAQTELEDMPDCQYCTALKKVNDPEEGECPYCERNEAPADALASCKYCAASEAPGTDCKYCARPEMAEQSANGSDCQYCSDMAHRDAECKYCGAGPSVQNPTTTDSQNFAGQALDAPAIEKPIPGAEPQLLAPTMDDTTNNNLALDQKGQGESNVQVSGGIAPATAGPAESVQVDQSKEAMQAIAQQIEQLPAEPNIVDGVSRPENYSQNTPGDMSLDEDDTAAPDLGAVLSEGLDSHAQNIQRERVVQMVAEALSGFKACKSIIERAQQQAPQLYSSSIMMLKAMIEMAKMLGLEENSATSDQNPLEENPQSEWQNPFPTHPDNGGQPQPQHAPSAGSASQDGDANSGNEWSNPFPTHPENGGTIGQPVGKLPTGQTTPHVARTPLAPGAVNAQGQKKWVDPETGKESFINMKEGRVLNEHGKPVKPAQG